MQTKFKQRLNFLSHVWQLTYPYWFSGERWIARALLASILILNLGTIYISVRVNKWYADFYNSLQEKNFEEFTYHIWYFIILATFFIIAAVYRLYLNQMLQIRWRKWMTECYFDKWFKNRAYYKLELESDTTDNPDQRIAQDIAYFTADTLNLVLGLFNAVITLISFVVILWGISGSITLPVINLTIPGYMVWFAVLYAFVGTWLTHLIGRKLIGINFNLEKYQAHFRYNLVRFRENAEGIALYSGEEDEKRGLLARFMKIWDTWWELMITQKRLTWFTSAYGQIAIIFPILVAAPKYFKGIINLGQLMQISQAFGQVQDSLSWFISAYTSLADWKASVNRLISFDKHLALLDDKSNEGILNKKSEETNFELKIETLSIPTGTTLFDKVNLSLLQGKNTIVTGPSGIGKSTLFRAISGIWPYGKGLVKSPKGKVMFLPQKAYLPIDTLKNVAAYPSESEVFNQEQLTTVFDLCKLAHLKDQLEIHENWANRLSPGEQQRLAFARALLQKPDWLFMDEPTSSLDENSEKEMYDLLKQKLPDCTLVSISHKESTRKFHEAELKLEKKEDGVQLNLAPI